MPPKLRPSDAPAGDPGGSQPLPQRGAPSLSEEDQGESLAVFTQLCQELSSMMKETLPADGDTAGQLEELEEWRIGGGFVSFGGVDDVHGVVNLDLNTNNRVNPRPLNLGHAEEFLEIFLTRDGKQDHRSPIYLVVDPKQVDDDLKARMKAVDIRNPAIPIPRFDVLRPHGARERLLEHNVTWKFDQATGRSFSQDEINEFMNELLRLRAERALAQLLNGNHRMMAMVLLAARATPARDSIIGAVIQRRELDKDEVRYQMEEMKKIVSKLTYPVEVYSIHTPCHLLTRLSENTVRQISLAPGRGERLWTEASRLNAIINVAVAKGSQGGLLREDVVTAAAKQWLIEQSGGSSLGQLSEGSEINGQDKSASKGKARKSMAKEPPQSTSGVSRPKRRVDFMYSFIRHGSTIEMALSCRWALFVFDKILNSSHVKSMITERGASLTAHVWLSIRTLLKITDVTTTGRLYQAEQFLHDIHHDSLDSEGNPLAADHWDALHPANNWDTPTYLDFYNEQAASDFTALLLEEDVPKRDTQGFVNYKDPDTILAVRRVFFRFAARYDNPKDEIKRLLAASFRLYACLPTYSSGLGDSHFFPAALLPATSWINDMELQVSPSAGRKGALQRPPDENIWMLDALVDHSQLLWTVGRHASMGKPSNNNNLYRSSGSLHQIVLECADGLNPNYTCLQGRLQEAIEVLDDRRLHLALHHVSEEQGSDFFKELREGYSTFKSPKAHYSRLKTLCGVMKWKHGSAHEVSTQLTTARESLTALVQSPTSASTSSVRRICGKHKVLGLIHLEHFHSKNLLRWCEGWPGGSDKKRLSVISCVGWGLLSRELTESVLPRALSDKSPMRWLLHVARNMRKDRGLEAAWWDGSDRFDDALPDFAPPSPVRSVPNPTPSVQTPPTGGSIRRTSSRHTTPGTNPRVSNRPSPTPAGEDSGFRPKSPRLGPSHKPRSSGPVRSAAQKQVKSSKIGGGRARKSKSVVPSNGSDSEEQTHVVAEPTVPSRSTQTEALGGPDGNGEVDERDRRSLEPEAPRQEQMFPPSPEIRPLILVPATPTPPPPASPAALAALAAPVAPVATKSSLIPDPDKQLSGTSNPTTRSLPPGFVNAIEQLREFGPKHVVGLQAVSEKFPSAIWTKLSLCRQPEFADSPDRQLPELLRVSVEKTLLALTDVAEERLRLRESMLRLVGVLQNTPYGSELAMTGLMPQLLLLRDIFVARVAVRLQHHFGCKEASAISEALSMAVADGLYDENKPLLSFNDENNSIGLNSITTFPWRIQNPVNEEEAEQDIFDEVTGYKLPTHPEDYDSTLKLMRWFRPVWAPGRTEAECHTKALENIAALTAVHADPARSWAPPEEGMAQDPTFPPVPLSTCLRELVNLKAAQSAIASAGWKPVSPPRFITTRGVHSPFSSGRILPDGAAGVMDHAPELVQQAFKFQQEYFGEEWKSTQDDAQAEWASWIQRWVDPSWVSPLGSAETPDENMGEQSQVDDAPSPSLTGSVVPSSTRDTPAQPKAGRLVQLTRPRTPLPPAPARPPEPSSPIIDWSPIPDSGITDKLPNPPQDQAPERAASCSSQHTTDEELDAIRREYQAVPRDGTSKAIQGDSDSVRKRRARHSDERSENLSPRSRLRTSQRPIEDGPPIPFLIRPAPIQTAPIQRKDPKRPGITGKDKKGKSRGF